MFTKLAHGPNIHRIVPKRIPVCPRFRLFDQYARQRLLDCHQLPHSRSMCLHCPSPTSQWLSALQSLQSVNHLQFVRHLDFLPRNWKGETAGHDLIWFRAPPRHDRVAWPPYRPAPPRPHSYSLLTDSDTGADLIVVGGCRRRRTEERLQQSLQQWSRVLRFSLCCCVPLNVELFFTDLVVVVVVLRGGGELLLRRSN